ncbi:hypothetical protein [Paracoccus pacificus]|uniref:Suppressor of fused protein (SUFU) n=1 Tax=Paracoccus pacificus TaxID=1463598 RepID=A0ABW4R5W5_9RHOB
MADEDQISADLGREKAALSDLELAMPGFPTLVFRTAFPEQLDWFDNEEEVTEFAESALFTEFRRLWLGYEPAERDKLEISIYGARIIPERVALPADYGRLFASKWGPDNFGVDGNQFDFGEVLTGETTSGFDWRVRISVWRRGDALLIIRARTNADELERLRPQLAAFIGSLEFTEPADDPIMAGLVRHSITLPSGATFDYGLPPHWKVFTDADAGGRPIAAAVYLDRADQGGNSAIGIFGITVPEGAKAADAPLRDIASGTSDLLLENLLPEVKTTRRPMQEDNISGFRPDTPGMLFLDRLDAPEHRPMGAAGFFLALPTDVVGYSAITAYPTDQEAMGLLMHANFIQRLVVDDLRRQFGASE